MAQMQNCTNSTDATSNATDVTSNATDVTRNATDVTRNATDVTSNVTTQSEHTSGDTCIDNDRVTWIFEYTMRAYSKLREGIGSLIYGVCDKLSRVPELLMGVIGYLSGQHDRYEDLHKEWSRLLTECRKLNIEIKSLIKTVKERTQKNNKIVREAEQQMLKGNSISTGLDKIEATVEKSQTSSEQLKKKYDDLIDKLTDFCSKATSLHERNKDYADLAGQLPLGAVEEHFQKYAENVKDLVKTLSQIDQVVWQNFEVLTEICQLLNVIIQDVVKGSTGMKALVESNHTAGSGDMNDFLIAQGFDSFKSALEELEKNCDYLLDEKSTNEKIKVD